MVLRTRGVNTTDRLREVSPSQTTDFPYLALESDLNLFADRCSPWHWHECFEFAHLASGSMELHTDHSHAVLHAGDGYFVNANVLHQCKSADASSSIRLQVHQFYPGLIAGSSLVARRYILPVENAAGFDAMVLRRGDAAHAPILDALVRTFTAADTEPAAFEMEISLSISEAWKNLYALVQPRLRETADENREDVLRVKAMLRFIHQNYSQPISVAQIAGSAGVCERECFRCFARVLDATPRGYLTQHRVDVAARLLSETNASVTQIALQCGFTNSSYFGKVFRQMIGCSPREFRKN